MTVAAMDEFCHSEMGVVKIQVLQSEEQQQQQPQRLLL
jgi:hypothetical protein